MGRWLESYLIKRRITVKIGSSKSYIFCNKSGVPQGSNLGPLLFTIYFNDICCAIPPGTRLVYADDLKIFGNIQSVEDSNGLQQLLNTFQDWCRWNQMTISAQKCSFISFTRKKNPIYCVYDMCGAPIERAYVVKDLGVLLDTELTFKEHYSYIIAKANRNLGFIIRTAFNFQDPYCLRSLYFALVRSILETACVVWSPYLNIWVDRIEKIQHRFIRFALRQLNWTNQEHLPPYEDRCHLLAMETLVKRRSSARALFVAKLLLGDIDATQILALIDINAPTTILRTGQFLRLSFRRTTYGQNEPIQAMCREFNNVHYMFDFSLSVLAFKNRLKHFNMSL